VTVPRLDGIAVIRNRIGLDFDSAIDRVAALLSICQAPLRLD